MIVSTQIVPISDAASEVIGMAAMIAVAKPIVADVINVFVVFAASVTSIEQFIRPRFMRFTAWAICRRCSFSSLIIKGTPGLPITVPLVVSIAHLYPAGAASSSTPEK